MANMEQTKLFQMLADETRLRALALMQNEGELCVCELVYALELSQPKISRHLAALREAGVVTSFRRAQWVFYKLNKQMSDWQKQVIDAAFAGVKNEMIILADTSRIKTMVDRPERSEAA